VQHEAATGIDSYGDQVERMKAQVEHGVLSTTGMDLR
jgi:hypothetical protein